jgi:hypothetical protein
MSTVNSQQYIGEIQNAFVPRAIAVVGYHLHNAEARRRRGLLLQLLHFLTVGRSPVSLHWDALNVQSPPCSNDILLMRKVAGGHAQVAKQHRNKLSAHGMDLFKQAVDAELSFVNVEVYGISGGAPITADNHSAVDELRMQPIAGPSSRIILIPSLQILSLPFLWPAGNYN